MAIHVRSTIWVDFYGVTRQTILKGNATTSPVQAALAALSDAGLQDCWEGLAMGPSGSPITGAYNSAADQVIFTFLSTVGNQITVFLPAPDPTIFMADNRTVDTSNAGVVALAAAVIGLLVDVNGNPAASLVGGYRTPQKAGYY